jgi:hypothetical protein
VKINTVTDDGRAELRNCPVSLAHLEVSLRGEIRQMSCSTSGWIESVNVYRPITLIGIEMERVAQLPLMFV